MPYSLAFLLMWSNFHSNSVIFIATVYLNFCFLFDLSCSGISCAGIYNCQKFGKGTLEGLLKGGRDMKCERVDVN